MTRTEIPKTCILRLLILVIISSAMLTGCMSLTKVGDDEIAGILSLINEGEHERLSGISSNPFLLDGEILHGSAPVRTFWKGLADSGFSLTEAEIIRNEPLTSGDAALFAETPEVNAFFNRYIPEYSVVIEVSSKEGRTLLILGTAEDGNRKLAAWGGPY